LNSVVDRWRAVARPERATAKKVSGLEIVCQVTLALHGRRACARSILLSLHASHDEFPRGCSIAIEIAFCKTA
jgi:hypothetical protein